MRSTDIGIKYFGPQLTRIFDSTSSDTRRLEFLLDDPIRLRWWQLSKCWAVGPPSRTQWIGPKRGFLLAVVKKRTRQHLWKSIDPKFCGLLRKAGPSWTTYSPFSMRSLPDAGLPSPGQRTRSWVDRCHTPSSAAACRRAVAPPDPTARATYSFVAEGVKAWRCTAAGSTI